MSESIRDEAKERGLLEKEKLHKNNIIFEEQEKREKVVKESEKFYKSIFELSGVGIAEVSPDGMFLMINKPFCKITGYSEEELKEKSFEDITYPEDIDVDLNYVNDLLAGKINGYNMGKRYIRKDGAVIWVNLTVSLVRDNDKNPKYFVSVINDITDNKKNEIELKKQAQAVFYCPVSIVVTNKNGIIEYVNPAFEIISGYKKEEALGKNPKIQSSGEENREFYKNLWNTILKGQIWKGTFKNKKKNGEIYWEESSISPIINSQGKITHFVAVKEDITKRKLIEEELIKSKIEAESANRAKSAFLANMSHEIRTPLNAILGFSGLLLNDSNLSEEQKSKVKTINRTGEHLLKMINEILEISKIEAGKASINLSKFNMYRVIEDLKNIFYLKAKDKNICLNFFIDDVPEVIITDELKLRQILINLIGNAIKFTDKGSVSVAINSKNEQDDSLLYVAVKDTGIGIQEENLNKIFDDFTQVYDTRYSKGGTGLGLTITKEFVELLEGSITLKSTYGKGSEFSFFIPVTIANNSKEKSYIKIEQNESNDASYNEKEVCSLEAETKLELKEAILDGDVDEINEIINNTNKVSSKEAEYLKKLAGEFKYEKILELL